MKPKEWISFGPPGQPVQSIIPSPNGQFLVLVYNAVMSVSVGKAALFRKEGSTFVLVGLLPVASRSILVLDDGVCIVVLADYDQITLVRCVPGSQNVMEESRWTTLTGLSLFAPDVLLLPSGNEVLLGTTDRDDGHGWTVPTYSHLWQRLEVPSGKVLQESDRMIGCKHTLLAPASPCASPYDGGNLGLLTKLIASLRLGEEWARRVGPTLLLTSARVIHVATEETLVGKLPPGDVYRTFYDLSAQETHALATARQGDFELWDLQTRRVVVLPFPSPAQIKCAAFLPNEEMVLGTEQGTALLLR